MVNTSFRTMIFCTILFLLASYTSFAQKMIPIENIHIRDPFVLVDQSTKTYYLYKTASVKGQNGDYLGGVEVMKGKDLKTWSQPKQVFTVPADNWITGPVWAPEVHSYKGKYYLFATLNSSIVWKKASADGRNYTFRGTQIFWSDSPEGPFKAFDVLPHTPMDEMALDGTLYVENGIPYMVYCHEWLQVIDGEMKVVQLKDDLSAPVGNPIRLFCASAAPWSTEDPKNPIHVTDGCFLYKTKKGKLLMIWSSFMNGSYAIGVAESASGRILGPWKQNSEPLFKKDGGHGMIFKDLEGRLRLVIHSPNVGPNERAKFFELEDTGDTIILKE